jgi:hypothetical protein
MNQDDGFGTKTWHHHLAPLLAMEAQDYFCEARPTRYFPNLKRAGDMLGLKGEGSTVFLYWSLFSWNVPCMYCGEDSDCGLTSGYVPGTLYRIVFCIDKCFKRGRDDLTKVEALFAEYAQAKALKAVEANAEARADAEKDSETRAEVNN